MCAVTGQIKAVSIKPEEAQKLRLKRCLDVFTHALIQDINAFNL